MGIFSSSFLFPFLVFHLFTFGYSFRSFWTDSPSLGNFLDKPFHMLLRHTAYSYHLCCSCPYISTFTTIQYYLIPFLFPEESQSCTYKNSTLMYSGNRGVPDLYLAALSTDDCAFVCGHNPTCLSAVWDPRMRRCYLYRATQAGGSKFTERQKNGRSANSLHLVSISCKGSSGFFFCSFVLVNY